jgi:site-specific recombinase XerD
MTTRTTALTVGDLETLRSSFELTLRARNLAPSSIDVYSEAVMRFRRWLADQGMPTDVERIGREHIEAYEAALFDRGCKANTVAGAHRFLQAFFKWAVEEREIQVSPLANMKPPRVPESQIPVPAEDDLRKLLAACEGRDFESLRDAALIRVLLDTGVRAGEAMGLHTGDVDVHGSRASATVLGKGRRPRTVPLGAKTAVAVDRYLRARRGHRWAKLDWLWLGQQGRFTAGGLAQMLIRRCDQAGIARLHPHQMRHFLAHSWLLAGGNEVELMSIAGWRSRDMLARYGRATVAERAAEAHRRLSPGDRL